MMMVDDNADNGYLNHDVESSSVMITGLCVKSTQSIRLDTRVRHYRHDSILAATRICDQKIVRSRRGISASM